MDRRISENWGINHRRVREFFEQQSDVERSEQGYVYQKCVIRIHELAAKEVGAIRIERTQVEMEGPEPEITQIHNRFILHFLSAGG